MKVGDHLYEGFSLVEIPTLISNLIYTIQWKLKKI